MRAEEILTILESESKNAFQVASDMTWDIKCDSWDQFPLAQKWFATGEARVVLLRGEGQSFCAGLELVLCCDIRLCSQEALFAFPEAKLGFITDVGGLQRLPRIVGKGHAREIAGNPPLAVQGAKEVILFDEEVSLEESLEYNDARSSMIVPSEDLFEAVSAYMQKRKGEFKGA